MRRTNSILLGVAVALLGLSFWVYRVDTSRATRFERGQKLIQNLDPQEVTSIEIVSGEETVHLKRKAEGFTVTEKNDYRAKNEAVNRLIRDLMGIALEKKVGRGEALEAELGIEPLGEESIEVVLRDSSDKDMVRLRLGNRLEGSAGRYVARLDEDERTVYLTQGSPYLETKAKSFLASEIVDVPADTVVSIEGVDYRFERVDGELALADVPTGKSEKAGPVGQVKSALSRLRFEEVFLADAPEVRDLSFSPVLSVGTEGGALYRLSQAKAGDKHYVQIEGETTVSQVEFTKDTSEEELEDKAEMLARADEIKAFNQYHASWVYEVSESLGQRLDLRKSDLTE